MVYLFYLVNGILFILFGEWYNIIFYFNIKTKDSFKSMSLSFPMFFMSTLWTKDKIKKY